GAKTSNKGPYSEFGFGGGVGRRTGGGAQRFEGSDRVDRERGGRPVPRTEGRAMSIRWIDVSIPMRPGMTVWPGDVEFRYEPTSRIADGAGANVSSITLSTHTGTHVDAPW